MSAIEVFSDSHDLLGESPRWHPSENRLYWVDIEAGSIHSQSAQEASPLTHQVEMKVGCLAFERSGAMLLATSRGIQRWNANRSVLTLLADPEVDKSEARFNDGLVDAAGRFWAGTMTETDASSALYCLDTNLDLRTMTSGITISNGIGWNPENNLMYFTDTMKRTIWRYDFDLATGTLSNQRPFLEFSGEGLPDGLAVDTEGNVWVVLCGGGCIQVHAPTGQQLDLLRFPTRCITACTFGGDDLSDLYVTSSRVLLPSEELARDTLAGNVFRLSTHAHGLQDHFFG
ncbi:MAG: SMP-30/gluconolactonase/LRE family protein [Anaerolineaceae bacterium]|nr:SMP-30/gluconolactonase/LRE family protein [Anaerolineaceae bacterium]MBN2678560.1 SMP-30/gluconolactonase/LRE family protein [Anaerolineaceae bacterium]